jgi:hypothetical protein
MLTSINAAFCTLLANKNIEPLLKDDGTGDAVLIFLKNQWDAAQLDAYNARQATIVEMDIQNECAMIAFYLFIFYLNLKHVEALKSAAKEYLRRR